MFTRTTFSLGVLAMLVAISCDRVPLIAPTNSTVTIDAGSRVVLVPADVEDVIAISAAFRGKGATHLAPGSLRWLGDVRDASAARVGR